MFRRKDVGLPYQGGGMPDGSGRAIRMDSPLLRSWKNASTYIKGSYLMVAVSILITYGGYRHLRYNHASVWLTCHAQECTLDITPPGRSATTSVTFARHQLVKTESVKVDKFGNFVRIDNDRVPKPVTGKKKKKTIIDPKGPDADGNYDSYQIILQPAMEKDVEAKEEDEVPESDLSILQSLGRPMESGELAILMRQYNLGQSRRRTRTMVSRLDSYIKKRRHKMTIKETASLSWQGILGIVLGLFSLLLSTLLGQFWEEPKLKQGGPGSRRQIRSPSTTTSKSRHHSTKTARKHH